MTISGCWWHDFESWWKGRENEAKSRETNDFANLINQLKKRFSIKPSQSVDDQETTMSMGTIPEEP